jgi:hypothetical protein
MELAIKDIFSGKRFFNLCKIEFFNNWKMFLIKDLVIILVIINLSLIAAFSHASSGDYSFFFFINILVGVIFASNSFKVIQTQESGISYFMFPASIEEKFTVKILFSLVLYFLSATIGIFIASLISETIRFFIFKASFNLFNPFNFDFLRVLLTYFVFHSIFFFGSIVFKKNNFLKTVFALILTSLLMTIIGSVIVINFLKGSMHSGIININLINVLSGSGPLSIVLKVVIFLILPLVFYTLTLLRLKKAEAK